MLPYFSGRDGEYHSDGKVMAVKCAQFGQRGQIQNSGKPLSQASITVELRRIPYIWVTEPLS